SVGDGQRLTVGQSRRLCEVAGHIGYGVEPDARMTNRAYRADESLAVFLNISDEQVDAPRYLAAACMMHVGLLIAHADGHVDAKDEIAQVIGSLTSHAVDEPVTVAAASTGAPGERIPAPPASDYHDGGLKLDRAAIAAIMKDTKDVAEMLAAAMSAGAELDAS